jgi:hypothetical protein
MPKNSKLEQSKTILSEIVIMIFNYHMLLFTEFTSSELKLSIASSVSILTAILAAFLGLASYIPKVHLAHLYFKRCILKRRINKKQLSRRQKHRQAR